MPTARFDIAIPQPVLDDLRVRLSRVRLARIPGAKGWSLGTDPEYLTGLIAYWRDTFDWRTESKEFQVPRATREVIVRLGLLDGVGQLDIDQVVLGRVDHP